MNDRTTHPAEIMRKISELLEDLEKLQEQDNEFHGIWKSMQGLDLEMRDAVAKRRANARVRSKALVGKHQEQEQERNPKLWS